MSHVHYSTKKFGPISTGHRQWKAEDHCSFIHGYGRYVEIMFSGELDEKGWVVDFGDLRWVKEWLEAQWDHRVLIAHDDKAMRVLKNMHTCGVINMNVMPKGYGPGIEDSARFVFDYVDKQIQDRTQGRCFVTQVRVWEHENNSAICQRAI